MFWVHLAVGLTVCIPLMIAAVTGTVLAFRPQLELLFDIRPFMQWTEDIHRHFGYPKIGKPIRGAGALCFFFLSLSGLALWWPSKWSRSAVKAAVTIDPHLRGKRRDWNWHNVFGFWMLPVLLLISSTGIILAYSWAFALLSRAVGHDVPRELVRSFHTGEAGGLLGQFIAMAGAVTAGMLIWTGVSLTWRRYKGRKKKS